MTKHPLSCVDPKAIIGDGVTIGPFVTIEADVVIGEGTIVESNATIKSGSRIGKNCHIFPNAVIGAVPQDLKFQGEYSTAEIGDNTTIRECVTINRGTAARGKTTVGSNCLLMAYVHVGHDSEVGNHVILVNNVNLAGEVHVDDWAILGGLTAVHQFSKIGKHVMISGGSLVSKDIPPYAKVGKMPLQYAGINTIGLRRRGFTNEQITQIQEIYRVVYQSNFNNTQAVEYIRGNFEDSVEVQEFLKFMDRSDRGIIRGNLSVSSANKVQSSVS